MEVTHAQMARATRLFPGIHRGGIAANCWIQSWPSSISHASARPSGRPRPAVQHLGLQTLYDRYFLHVRDRGIELPQAFFMRVAMGLANEGPRGARSSSTTLSTFDFMGSTPTLFNSGTLRRSSSSCYLTTVADDLTGIYDAIKENALLAKYAGGWATTGRRSLLAASRAPTASAGRHYRS